MNAKFSKLIPAIMAACSIMMVGPVTTEAATTYFEANQNDVPVYDNRSGSLKEVGYLVKNQDFKVKSDWGNWLQIDFGGYFGYVAKNKTNSVVNPDYKNTNTNFKNSKTNIITIKNALVMDNTSGTLVPFATIKQGQTYPLISTMGNWFTIDVNGRYGFIHNTAASLEGTNVKETSEPSDKIYIKAINAAPLYDNRRGNLDEIGKLTKGQEIEVVSEYGSNWWKVKWANTYAYVLKASVEPNYTKDFKNDTTKKSSTKQIIPLRNGVEIFDNTGGKLVPFATLDGNQRYPILNTMGNWYLIDFGGRTGYIHNSKVQVDKGIAILMYHHILDESEIGNFKGVSTTITTEQFAKEMAYLHQQGFETIKMDDVQKYVIGKISLPSNVVAITFDDGLLSVKENAYPILKQYGMKATEYMITARNYNFTSDQVFTPQRLQFFSQLDIANLSDVFDYQAHTYNMHNMVDRKADLVTKPYEAVKADIAMSKNTLNAHSFAYPFGIYNSSTLQIMKELGFTNAVTTKIGNVNIGDDPLQLNRHGIIQSTTLTEFANIVH